MAQSMTSFIEIRARQEALPVGQRPVLASDSLFYATCGVGSNRDGIFTLDELMTFLSANEKFDVLKLVKDSSNDITIKWDSTNSEFVIWDRSNDTGKVVAVPKFHAHGNATFEKDVTIAADLDITKTLEVMLTSEFHGQVECDEYLISKKGLQSKGMTSVERLNMGSDESNFGVSTNSSINALLGGTTIDVSVGDIVVLHNTGNSDITVTLGTMLGSGGEETKSTTLKSLCAMQFMCCYKSGGYTHWVPLGNATVTWA